jgi:hypothetical protein
VRGLEASLRRQYGVGFAKHEFTVAVQGPIVSARYYFPSNFRSVTYPTNADFVIGFTMQDADHALTDRPIFKVMRMGALLSVVVDHREALADQRRPAKIPIAGAVLRPKNPAAYQ